LWELRRGAPIRCGECRRERGRRSDTLGKDLGAKASRHRNHTRRGKNASRALHSLETPSFGGQRDQSSPIVLPHFRRLSLKGSLTFRYSSSPHLSGGEEREELKNDRQFKARQGEKPWEWLVPENGERPERSGGTRRGSPDVLGRGKKEKAPVVRVETGSAYITCKSKRRRS